MFTGLVAETGSVVSLQNKTDGSSELLVRAPRLSRTVAPGDSVAVNGCCLTVTARENETLHFDLLAETRRLTNLPVARLVNLEPALAASGRFGGHLVQGHIDGVAAIRDFKKSGADHRLEIELPSAFARYVVRKGSIAIDGISLTVAEVGAESFVVWIIPHTFAETNLREARAGAGVNLECDLVAKYVERLLQFRGPESDPADAESGA